MTYPTPGAYQEALQFPADAFTGPLLRAAEPETNALGLPVAMTGAYAVVFPVEAGGRRWAVKLFTSAAPDVEARYRAVARFAERHDLPYLLPFTFEADGIRVGGRTWPVVRMAWAEGATLGRYVAAHHADADRMRALADAWDRMLDDLEAVGVAHGDLQHGNVLVADDGGAPRLTLVDYDALVVPALARRPGTEVGHRNYQHPDRSARDVGPHLDRFAGLVVATALRALADDPSLWSRYDTGENLLFRADDFYDPGASPLFAELAARPAVAPFAAALRTACLLEPEAAPRTAAVARGETVPPPRHPRRRRPRGEEAATSPRGPFERWWGRAVLAWALVAAALFLTGALAAGGAAVLGGAAAALGAAAYRYRRLPGVQRRARLAAEAAYVERVVAGLESEIEGVEARRRDAFASVEAVKAERLQELRNAALYDHLKHHFVGEASGFDGISHKVVVRLKAAGIRTAYHATPDRITPMRDLSDASKARVGLWRAALVAEASEGLPERLSPAEERRMDRLVARRAEALEAEAARLREKVRAQQAEGEAIRQRLAGLPARSFGAYLRRLAGG